MNLKKNSVKLLAATLGAATLGFVGVTATAHADSIYTVKSGDTLSEISYECTNTIDNVNSLAQKNNISDVNVIYVGQKLYLSNNGSVTSATSEQVATTPAASSVTSAASSAVASSAASSATSTATSAASSQVASSATSTAQSSSTSTASSTTTTSTTSSTSGSEAAAEAWIVARESGGSYTASNGNYYGKYQLTKSMLNGDLSAANQDKVANAYVASRYGSWVNAKAFWEANGWY